MTRTGKTAGVLALLAALLIGSPVSAGDSDTPLKDQVRDLRAEIAKLRREIANLRRLHEIDSQASNRELELLTRRMERIERSLERLSSTPTERTSRFFDPRATTDTGTIRLVNRLGVTATVTIDGVDYNIPPFSTRTIRNQPAGTISYSRTAVGFGLSRTRRTTLRPNETLTLTIY
jgi:hypothetical protein